MQLKYGSLNQCALLILLFSVIGVWAASARSTSFANAQASENSYECSLRLAETTFTQSEPIVLTFSFANRNAYPVDLNLGYNREAGILLTLKQPDGKVVQAPRRRRDNPTLLGKFAVRAGEHYSQQLILNDWFDLNQLGTYELQAELRNPPRDREGQPLECDKQSIVFTIGQLDVEKLQRICEGLTKTIGQNVVNYERASNAAKVLATINHPIVVGFLRSVMELNPRVNDIMIPALERIGNDEAIAALIEVLGRSERDTEEFIDSRSALISLEKTATNPATQEKIRIALARITP